MSSSANTGGTSSGAGSSSAQHGTPPPPLPPVSVGILPADEILEEVRQNRMIKDGVEDSVQACSYDMRVGTIFKHGRIIKGQQGAGDVVFAEPGEVISLFTLEELNLPDDVAATAFPINAMSSEGLLVLNPGHIDPGFKGPLTVRAINVRATRKSIDFDTPIFTVIFERLSRPTPRPYAGSVDRRKREIKFNSTDLEQNPKSIANLVKMSPEAPITKEGVKQILVDHWMTKLVFAGTIVTVALSAIAAVFAIIAVFRASPSPPAIVNPTQSGPVATPVITNSPPPSGDVNNSNQNSTQPQGNIRTTNRSPEGGVRNQN